jgi:hypothetical protein
MVNVLKIHAVREDPKDPHLECYSRDISTLAALAVAKVSANHQPTPTKESTNTVNAPTRPLASLPARLDAAACLQILERIDPEFKTESIEAARSSVDVGSLDSALAYTELSTSDRMNLKAAMVRHGILARGRSVAIGRI